MNASIVADGRERLESALVEKIRLRHAEVLRDIGARHESELAGAGFLRRWLIRRRIEKEVTAVLEREFPSRHALFIR
jgi:hypothetical protein